VHKYADPLVLAVDQSTSATKAILFDQGGCLVGRTTEEHRQFYPQPGWVEHDPVEIFEKTLLAIRRLLEETGVKSEQLAAFAITNQRETALIWDRDTGQPVYNAIVWQCQRGASTCLQIKSRGYEDTVRSKTGLVLDAYFSASKLKWILDNVPGVREAAGKGRLAAGTVDSWLIWRLTGGQVHATDFTNACRTMLLNLRDLDWDQDLLDLFALPPALMPALRPSDAIFGHTSPAVLPGPSLPISGVMGDSHAALFAQNCFESGMAKATYGTGSSIMMNIASKPLAPPPGLVTSIGWVRDGEVVYVYEGNIHSTGDTIKWLVDSLELIPDSRSSEQLAVSVPDSGGVYFVPAFAGLGAPYWDSEARAAIWGMTRGSKRAHVVRAGLEAIAYQVRDLLDLMASGAGVQLKELRVDGGATRNDFLMQFQADMLCVPVVRTRIEEASALGAAYMGGLGCGLWKDLREIAALRQTDRVFEGRMEEDARQQHYDGWKRALARTLTPGRPQ
jgi:glycerol kinase